MLDKIGLDHLKLLVGVGNCMMEIHTSWGIGVKLDIVFVDK